MMQACLCLHSNNEPYPKVIKIMGKSITLNHILNIPKYTTCAAAGG